MQISSARKQFVAEHVQEKTEQSSFGCWQPYPISGGSVYKCL